MALLHIPLDQITENDLQRLITTGAAESLYVDYKQQTYGGGESEHAEFLADISSFANTAGGDLIIGMTEREGVPLAFAPFPRNPDDEKRRLEDIARGGLEPRIRNLSARPIPIATGGHVIVIRVPRSYLPPHRVIFKGRKKFWARASSGKYEPNVEELRHLFSEAPRLSERIQSFRIDRIAKIMAGETPIPLSAWGKIVVHVIPIPAFADGRLNDIVSEVASGTHVPLPLDGRNRANQVGVNLDGFVNYTDNPTGMNASYSQFFRSGAIEGVSELGRRQSDGAPYFVGAHLATTVIFAIRQYLEVLKSYNAGLPISAFLSLCGVDGCYFRAAAGPGYDDVGPLRRSAIALPDIAIDNEAANVPALMRPSFNMLWNAFGFLRCDMYDGQGKWTGTT